MKADTLTVKTLFQREIRYVIPTFQRPYVWKRDEQWEPLWEDVRNVAEHYCDNLAATDGKQPLAAERTGTHFLGAVVLQQLPTAVAEIETRTVIDGQQRLTTLQLFVDAAQEIFEKIGADVEASRLSRLVLNTFAEGDDAFKLWPTSLDQPAFRAAMRNDAATGEFASSLIVQAHDFFRLQIQEWLDATIDEDDRQRNIHGLETAVYGLLEMVVIDLGTGDDAHVIFETLNARGTPLLASDLVKNYVLQTTARLGNDADALYAKHWRTLDDPWWRKEVRQGRLLRPRIDVFLNYWLIMTLGHNVQTHEVFPQFRSLIEQKSEDIEIVISKMESDGKVYRSFDNVDPYSVEGVFWYRWQTMDAGVTTPLLLWLFTHDDPTFDDPQRQRCLMALESFLIRRMLCRMTTKSYHEIFLELLKRVKAAEAGTVADTFVSFLSGQTAEGRLWPSDHKLRGALLDLPLYRLLTRGRLRVVLEALENALRNPKCEEEHAPRGTLTIEHILPQNWQTHWPLPSEEDPVEGIIERDRILHGLGNLTLVNQRLNTSLSNGPWPDKRAALGEHSVLHLNKHLLNGWNGSSFAEAEIRARGEDLGDRVVAVWPRPAEQ